MLFNSLSFFIFFPITTLFYFLLPHRFRWFFLLFISIYFYMCFVPAYILILFFTIVIDYTAAILMDKYQGQIRKFLLIISILSTCSILFVFKYFNFFSLNFSYLSKQLGLHYPEFILNIILPIGLSFHIFQSLSYVIEVYRGQQRPEKHFGIYSLYVMFYPQMVAGPIERPQNLLHQFRIRHSFDYNRVTDGLKLMAWGLFKKVVIADRLALYVNEVYGTPHEYSGVTLILATVFFAFQIYCDFSGYSDIAIGAAKVLGFNLMTNFNRPYFSKTVGEFWQRWHISLSTWFRDYVYFPLGGNRGGKIFHARNLIIVFLFSGLWHGANWTYIIWGGLNATYVLLSNFVSSLISKKYLHSNSSSQALLNFLLYFSTFFMICSTWIFFRSTSVNVAFSIINQIFSTSIVSLAYYKEAIFITGTRNIIILSVSLFILFIVEYAQKNGTVMDLINRFPWPVRLSAYYVLLFSILIFGYWKNSEFIYFQF